MKRTTIIAVAIIAVGLAYSAGPWSKPAASAQRVVSPARASGESYTFAWGHSLNVNADSAPVFVKSVAFGRHVVRNMVYVLTGNNTTDCDFHPQNFVKVSTLYAFDAQTGRRLWTRSTSGPSRCTTAVPVAYRSWIYSPGLDGFVHKYNTATGKEFRGKGWPVRYTLNAFYEKESAALQVSGRYLYVTTGGFAGDLGHYEGHTVTINLNSGRVHIWNSLCSNITKLLSPNPTSPLYCQESGSAMWGRGEAVTDPVNGDVYVSTGNGLWDGKTNWGDSLLKLSPDGSKLLDSFTPNNQAFLNAMDQDVGSTGPAILPPVRANGRTYHLMVQGGKGPAGLNIKGPRVLYLIDRDDMSGKHGPGNLGGSLQTIDSPGQKKVLTAPAVWTDPTGRIMVIYANAQDITAYRVVTSSAAAPRLKVQWDVHAATPQAGNFTTPVIARNTLYVAHNGEVDAYAPETGSLLWSSKSLAPLGQLSPTLHWEYPAVAGGMLFMTDEGAHVYAYRKK